MAMVGNIEDLMGQVEPNSRLRASLGWLQGYLQGQFPEITRVVASQKLGDTARIPLQSDVLYVLVQCYEARRREQGRFEAHQRYTDVQFLCQGREWIDVCDLRSMAGAPRYDASGNVFFPLDNEPHSRLLLKAGEVAVLFPNDAHAPCLRVDGDGLVHKIVIKVKDAHLPHTGEALAH